MLVKSDPTPLIRPSFHGPLVVVLTGFHCMYSETPPYGNLGNSVISLLRPLWLPGKTAMHFLVKKKKNTTQIFLAHWGPYKQCSTVYFFFFFH